MRAALPVLLALAACSTDRFDEHLITVVPAEYEIAPPIAFSPNGESAAYRAKTGPEEWYGVRGSWRSRRFDLL